MHKMQVEEMRYFFSQKNTFEEISAILKTRHPCIRGYSVKSIKTFCEKRRIFFRDLSRPCVISEAVADDVKRNCYKIFFFE